MCVCARGVLWCVGSALLQRYQFNSSHLADLHKSVISGACTKSRSDIIMVFTELWLQNLLSILLKMSKVHNCSKLIDNCRTTHHHSSKSVTLPASISLTLAHKPTLLFSVLPKEQYHVVLAPGLSEEC